MKITGYNSLTSWLTLVACGLIGFFVVIPMRLAGLFFVILYTSYNTERAKASVPIVIFGVLRTLTGPFTAFLGETFGFRAVTLTGCVLAAVGVGSCYFAENITTATICLGLIYGLGLAFGNTLMPAILKLHFTEHINLINGIVLTGSCVGAIIMSPVITFLHSTYGTNGMFLILGGIFLNTIPAAILLKHPHNERRAERANDFNQSKTYHQNLAFILEEENQRKEDTSVETPIEYFPRQQNDDTNYNIVNDTNSNELTEVEKRNKNVSLALNKTNNTNNLNKIESKQTVLTNSLDIQLTKYTERKPSFEKSLSDRKFIDNVIQPEVKMAVVASKSKITWRSFRLFADPTFHSIMIVQSIHGFVTTLNWTIIVDYGRDKEISIEKSVYFVMFLPIAEIFGNMCLNWITDRHFMTRTNFSLICFLILVLDAGYIMWTYDFALMMIGVLIFGFISGAVGTTFPGLIIEFVEEEQQNMAFASRFGLYAFLCILKTPIIGYFRGTLGSYDWVYCIIMACSFICCILVKLTPLLASCRNKRKQSQV